MISPGDTVLISGDSWGCGEWNNQKVPHSLRMLKKRCNIHRGLEQFLESYGCIVYNVSEGGASNKDSTRRLAKKIEKTNPDFIFWIQTDPIRDLKPYTEEGFPKTIEEITVLQENLLKKTYEFLGSLNKKIYCMGGVFKLNETLMRDHSNLYPLIPSIIEFFGAKEVKHWVSGWIQHSSIRFSDEFIAELYKLPDPYAVLPKEWFYPDGVHPNRLAHKAIFEFILNSDPVKA